jgi:Uncharacterized protein conserved in bacteria
MNPKIKQRAMRRLKIVEGQVRGLLKMVEEEKYCIDIITQTSAVREALSGIEDMILENHLSSHVIEQMKSGKEPKAVREILSVYKLSKRK